MRGRIIVAPVKVRDIVKVIEKDGWYWVRSKGSHHQYKHPTKPGLVTVPGNPGDDVASGTLNNILKQAGLEP
ncbi:MAG TPA: type II toxin-antitoxin system HicA family toxin [Pyrinomonadaceae bacterium]